jgi:hypothetical protein
VAVGGENIRQSTKIKINPKPYSYTKNIRPVRYYSCSASKGVNKFEISEKGWKCGCLVREVHGEEFLT